MVYSLPIKRKRILTPIIDDADSASSSPTPSSCSVSNNGNGSESVVSADGNYIFKNKHFQHSGVNSAKKRLWRNLKQILTMERGLNWNQDDPTYSSIEAPPSFKPAKKYSDLSGLPANYKDPHTGIRYSSTEEFSTIKSLPMDIVSGYLSLRKAAPS